MSRKNVEDLYPLSPLQQGLFFHTLYAPTSGVYVEQLSCTLRGALDVEAFKQAWQQVVDRHPVLRTAFVWKELAEPIQVVRQRVKLPCVEEDWRGQSPVEQQEHLQAYLKADRERGFDLSKAPPLRVALFRLSDDSFHFLWSYHHLVLDGWCTPLVLREVFAFYEAFSQRRDISLERSRPYRDYIAWLRKQDLSKAEAFWRETLKGFSAPTPLSVDKTPERQTGDSEPQEEYREQQISLTTETTSALQSLARGQQLTLNTLMQGAWALLLSRYSGERDVVFGVTVSGRPAELAGVETMVGLFINTLPVRVKIDDRESLSAWLKQLQERQVELRQFEYSPLVQVQGWSEVARGVPLFESLLVFENYPVDASFKQQLAQLSIDNVHKIERTNYPLTLLAVPGTELLLHISYDRRRFSDATIKRMLGHLSTLLEGMVANPTQRLSSLPLLTQTERHQLLVEWNDTATAYPPDISLHELFQQQVARTPDHIAVRFEDEQLSYAELNTRANQLAHRLRAAGVGVETRVGVCVERSIEMVVALLGILKAGGAYVPLDASYPPERLTFMHRDAQVKLLLTQQRLLEALPARDAEVICLDRDWDGISGHDTENPRVAVSPQNAAYVIYTSGTTGQPKGVLNTHAGICNRLLWMQDAYALASDDRVLQKTPLSFDVSVWEVFWPLITGARLVVARAGGHQDAAYQREVIGKERITTLHFVPSMLQAFVSEPEVEGCRSLRQVMSSGEALSKELQERFFARLPNTALHNLYGPTEAAVDVTHWTCERETARLSVPIGRPIANTQLYILNDAWQPVPVGIAGELYIGGAGLARGYLHRPALTAEKFVPNPFAADAGRRLYRTGDKARYAEDGTIEFLGRLDHQVKLRGFRIELGEIETALLQHPSIRECVVVLREGANGDDKRIVAYTVAESGEAASHGSLRSFLKEKLPEYMLPSVFVALDALPLTPSGKIDRRALPVPARTHTTTDGSDAATTTGNPLEEVVAGVWAEVLGVETVGAHDNFFELGGHSLLALQVISRLRTVLKVEMPVRELFEAPTVRGFTERIEKQQRAALGLPSPPLERTARDGELPLSFAQQRLWFLDQLEPHSPAYNIPSAIRLTGELDLKALEESFNEVVRRHEVLRTSFAVVDRQAVQRIQPRLRLPLRLEDLRHLPVEQREASIESIAAEDASRAFDLKQAPLLRLRVLRVDDDVHVVLLVMHHIISDGWSLGVLIREVAALYESFSQNEPSPLAELSIQYGDFAQWQRAWLKDEALETQLQYWRQQLDGSLARLPLPTLQEQSATSEPRAFRGAKQQVALPLKLSEALKQLSRREGATLFMTLLAAFQTLLYRYTGEHDITVGSPVANRQHEEIEGLIGFFVNTLALRTDLSGNPSFAELLKRVREVCLGAYAHQDVPFEKLVEELQPQRSLHHSPLFQVMFVLQNAPLPSLELRGLKLAPLPIEKSDSKFDLTLSLEETRDGLKGVLEYDTDIFDAAAIRRLCGHFETLLEGVVANPTQRLSELPLLTVDERHELLVEWNDTRHDYPQESCFQQLFEKQVERTPDALAVSFVEADGRESNLTYRELNARANQLAHYLRRLGVRAETLVGILFERSPEMLVSVLGVYKAGGAYLPLDPAYPSERLSYMLADARVRVLLTRGRHAERLPTESVKVVYLDEASAEIEKESRENPPCVVAPENLAYVIYTSGSTGRPKGVMTSHRGLANLSRAEALAFGLKAETRVLQVASWSFDASVFEMVMTLMAGATLYLAPTETLLPGEAFTQFLQEHSINAIALTPTTLAAVPPAALPALQTVITGGEPCPAELVARWVQGHRFFNVYGPTETTTWATFSVCRADGRKPAIGRPVANTQVYILDDDLQPVPVGINGQIHIGGVALARGYLNQPRLTAEKFIPHPFSDEPGARLYRTGDIARRTTSGEIEFVGRTDQQVKLRGFRIELGEIEAALGAHAAVEECAVIMREDAPGERRIVAYVVLEGHANAPTIGEWRDYLKEKLPDYMLPAAFVVLETWPLTPNGKLNRRALPAPEQSSSTSDATTVAARTPNEKALADIWCEVLKREVVGIYDNFFELGGHSLLATQIVSRVCERFDVELPLRSLFEAPTVAGLTERVEAALGAVHERHLPAISPVDRNSELPLSFAQQRLWFLDQLEPGNPFYNIPSAVRLVGALNVAAFRRCVNEVIRRHEILRTTFHSTQGQPQQVISPASDLPLDVENLRALPEPERRAEVQRLAFEEANHPFDLAQGPLVRARLLQTAEQEHVLLVTMHHIVSDGWSFTILFREIGQLYEAYARGENTPLAPLTIQYADYAAWQRHWLTDERLDAELAYWKEQLKDAPPLLELPTDRPRPAVQSYRGASVELLISKELTEEIREMSQEQGATLFMTLLAAFQVLLARYSNMTDIVVGTPVANRTRSEVEGVIGFFVNTLVMRVEVGEEATFEEVLGRVREASVGGYGHQEVPFEKLVEEIAPERRMSQTPIFQVMFALQHAHAGASPQLYGLEMKPLMVENAVAKFDLTLSLNETGQEGLVGSIEYNTDLFDATTIERMAQHLETLLVGIVSDAKQSVWRLPLLTGNERWQLVGEWNETRKDYAGEACVHELFERQAERTPDTVALVSGERTWTYGEVNERANRLGRYLRKRGVGEEEIVGVMVERGVEMVVGWLGVMKAGGAYMPLDPSYPPERLAFILRDVGISLLLTEERLIETLPEHAAQLIRVDAERESIERESGENLVSDVSGANLVYVIYTSGSTGRPKGVCIAHGALSNHARAVGENYQLKPADRVLQFASMSFDVAAEELFASLTAGATVVLMPPDDYALHSFLGIVERQKISVVNLSASYWYEWVAALSRGEAVLPSSLRLVVTGSEKVSSAQLATWQKLAGDNVGWKNAYGPTEATITTTVFEPNGASQHQGVGSVPIGRPINNARVYLLDRELQPVPVGIAGELHIGGAGLARGYLNRAELTAEKFIPDPFGAEGGARLYKTGDWARYLPDGQIEFLRRIDQQVKLRGYRIELGEIEAALGMHPELREAVVVVKEDESAEKRLVAYVVPKRADASVASNNLRAYLSERLPAYMLPSAFVSLEEMPLTPNGKIDRRALPEPERLTPESSENFATARSPVEEMLAGIYAEVLKIERPGIHDNFFELGGHSLLATQVVSRVRELFHVELPLRALFEAPTVAALADKVEALSRDAQTLQGISFKPIPRGGELPLSFVQQRFWFLDQLMPESSAYNIPSAVRLKGRLDVATLERSFNEIVRRHEVLRTTFAVVEGRPVQVIAAEARTALSSIDLSEWPDAEREAEALRIANEEARKPFDLARDPLLRTLLIRLAADEFILLFTMHHIISDGWSAGVLIRELTTIYEAFADGQPSPLPELTIQYADFAHWQREWLRGEVLESRLAYWRKQFGDGLPTLNLPTDKPRPPVPTDHGAIQTLALPATLSKAIRTLSQRETATLFMTLLAAFKVLLYRYTGQEDILVGSSIANRNHVETESLIGLLINTLVLRTDLSGNPTFRELLSRVREVSLGAYAHQDLPFEQLLEELRPEWDAGWGAPVFQVAFQLQNFSLPTMELKDLTLAPLAVEGGTAKFDLSMSLVETPEALVASVEYNTDLFEAATVKRMLEHYRMLLESIVAEPSARISELTLLDEAERRQLLSESNPTFTSDSPCACLQSMFEAQVRRAPESVALVFENERLTYGELNRRANQLAHYLVKSGIGAESLVALCVERSVEMVVGILGILKAGGAYVPLDPAYPKERLSFILEDTQARLLLTQRHLTDALPEHHCRTVLVDAEWPQIAVESDENPRLETDTGMLAYIIYTSGSTGQPKGVLVSHENVARLFEATRADFQFDERDVWTLFHSYAFDFSVWELWGALLFGGRLVVVPYWVSRSAEAFHRLLCAEGVTVLNQTPSAFRQFMRAEEAAGQKEDLKLRLVIFGGEALELQSLKPWFARHGDERPQLINMFGITETTVHVTSRRLTAADLNFVASSVVGQPLACMQVYLLDGHGQLVPIGVPGEICVGGTGLARGYLNRGELTAERFIPHPFSASEGARLYRSGDLARRLPDGDIEYLGRIDSQVKLRGFRIELGEIESALAAHAGVRECVMLAREDTHGDRRLVAYFVASAQHPAPSTGELRDFLHEKLPEHMIPSAFIALDSMPLTPNGKVDRRALPAPDQSRPQLGAEFVAPRTPVEKELAKIWQELLGVEQVGIHDNFFELGGHSLLLTQLASWIRKAFQVEVPLRLLFDTPTVIEMTKAILARQVEQEDKTDLAQMLSQLKQLSPHEVKAMLEKMGGSR